MITLAKLDMQTYDTFMDDPRAVAAMLLFVKKSHIRKFMNIRDIKYWDMI